MKDILFVYTVEAHVFAARCVINDYVLIGYRHLYKQNITSARKYARAAKTSLKNKLCNTV